MHFPKNRTISTYLKYLFSYLLIATVLILGFYLIVRKQLTNRYLEQSTVTAMVQLNNFMYQLNEDINFLSQVDKELLCNQNVQINRFQSQGAYSTQAHRELTQYANASKIISSIIYLTKHSNNVLSTQLPVSWQDNVFHIGGVEQEAISFDPAPYLDASSGQLLSLINNKKQYLIYFPVIPSQANYVFFYTIDTTDIRFRLKSLVSEEMPAVALVDPNGQIIAAENPDLLYPYISSFPLVSGAHHLNSAISLCVQTDSNTKFSLVSVLSDDFLSKQIGETFASIYLTLALLGIVAFLLILLSMRITYLPLHRLTQKFVPGSDTRQSYLSQLDNAFSQVYQQNRLLNDKLENYRLSIQKSLLNAIVSSKPYDALHPHTLPDIDQFFDTDPDKEIFVVYICGASAQGAAASAQDTSFPLTQILKCFKSTLPEENACVVLETTTNSIVLLLNFTGSKPDKEEVLKRMLIHIYETYGCLSTISDSSCSPMDIPVLYEDAMRAADCWAQIPVVDFGALPPEFLSTTYCYPYEKLNELSDMLSANVFSEARMLTEELLQTVERYILLKNNLQDFFVRCVLIDMLTTIINSMNQSGINFIAYSDLYHELLFLCRSCPYLEKKEEIALITGKLIDLYEEKVSEKLFTSASFRQVIEENYCDPDFSITVLADRFHVTVSSMSHMFRKELGINFSDYLWKLRLKKAKKLLQTTDMLVEDISISVGYLNTSSFRRKFKQETGLTPLQYKASFVDSILQQGN